MAGQHLEAIDSTVQKTHEWLGAIAEASHLSKAFGPRSARHQHAVLVAGHVLAKLAAAAIPGVVIVALSVATIAAFVGGYLAALG
jgi:hypothetical protein